MGKETNYETPLLFSVKERYGAIVHFCLKSEISPDGNQQDLMAIQVHQTVLRCLARPFLYSKYYRHEDSIKDERSISVFELMEG